MEPADQSAGPSNTRQRAASPLQAVDLDVVVAEQRPAAAIGKRKLVESESEGEAPNPKPAARASTTGRKEPAQDLIAELPTPDAPPSVNDAGALDSLRAHLEPAKSTNFDPDDAAVDQVLLGNESLPDRDSSRHERLAGPETLAILSDFAQARASAQHPDSPATRQQPVHVEQPIRLSPNPARTASMPRSPQKRPRTEVKATHPSPRGTRSPVRPAAELIRSRHSLHDRVADASPRQTGMTRMSIPVRLEFDFRGVTADDPGSSREAARFETPSPAGSRSLLREEIMSNASKRRHALNRGIHKSSPDTVYVSTTIPPLRATPDEARRLHRPRSPSPVLSHAQRSDQILAGQQLVLAVKDQYRARISDLSERYGVRPTELFRLVNELPKSKGGAGSGVYWLDVEEGLKGHFGY